MEDITDSEKEDVVKKKVREIIELHLRGKDYSDSAVPDYINLIQSSILEELHSQKKPYKYAVTCTIMQKTGSALHSSKSVYWDSVSDGSVTVCWPKRGSGGSGNNGNDGNRSMICIVTVFAVSFYVN